MTKRNTIYSSGEWVGVLTIHHLKPRKVYRHAEKQSVWDVIQGVLNRGGTSTDVVSISIMRSEFYIRHNTDQEITL